MEHANGDRLKAEMTLERLEKELSSKQLTINDETKAVEQLARSLRDLESVYQVVKNERNQYISSTGMVSQMSQDMGDKIKVLETEIEILRTSVLDKQARLQRLRVETSMATSRRDTLRGELNRLRLREEDLKAEKKAWTTKSKKQLEGVEAQERLLLKLRERHTRAIRERNDLGAQLIERHEELVDLYERINLRTTVLRNGDVELQEREGDLRFLRLEAQELRRSIDLLNRELPRRKKLEGTLTSLEIETSTIRDDIRRAEAALTDPENQTRWRKLKGALSTLDDEDLEKKMAGLQVRLAAKEEKCMELTLVLEETTRLYQRTREQAEADHSDTLQVAKQVLDYQGKLADATKKVKALVSELSMYQWKSLQLEQEALDLRTELEDATIRLEAGEPPTQEAADEWERLLRTERSRELEATLSTQRAAEAPRDLPGGGKSTAPERPTAYLPAVEGSLPVARPYGAAGPFAPSAPSGQMRHIRKPATRPIEIS